MVVVDTFWAHSDSRCWALENLAFCDMSKVMVEVNGRYKKQTQVLKIIWSWLLTKKYILFHYVHNAEPTGGTQDKTWSKISLSGSGHLQWKIKWAHTYKIFCFLLRFHIIKWKQWEKTCRGPQCLLVLWKEKTLIASNELMRFYPLH